MFCFTCDIDWAPEEVITDTLKLFEQFEVKCTLFATHPSRILKSCDRDLFEIGIHPNFNPLFEESKKDPQVIITDLISEYPEAIGIRSHGLTTGTKLITLFKKTSLIYDSNLFLPYFSKLKVFDIMEGWVRIPFNWEDDTHFLYGYPFTRSRLSFGKSNLNIMNFHPIHIFLNTDNNATYQKAKKHYQDSKSLIRHINKSQNKGARDLLINRLEYAVGKKIQTYKLHEII